MEVIQYNPNKKLINKLQTTIPITQNPREVLVKVIFSGICGTDLHIINGDFPCSSHPLTLGHEFSAIVVDFGSEVTNLTKGDHVVVDPNSSCHKCEFCHSGNPHFCSGLGFYANLGVKHHGGWAEYCICSIEQIHKLPSGVSLKLGALVEPLSCLAHGWDLISPVPVGKEILVLGAGIIGTLWVCLLHLYGHGRITVVEINEKRRNLLRRLIEETNVTLLEPQELQTNNKFDFVIDCTGNAEAIEKGFNLLNRGGKICIFGVAAPDVKIQISSFEIYMKELTILSVKVNPFSFPKALGLVEALGEKYLNFELLGIQVFKLQEFSEALKLLKNGDITKAVFQI